MSGDIYLNHLGIKIYFNCIYVYYVCVCIYIYI